MLPKEGAPLLGVAAVAGLVQGRPLEQAIGRSAVYVVAIGTGNQAEANWMHRRLVDVGTLLTVAAEADVGLRLPVQDRVPGGMDAVAAGAGQLSRLMGAAFPVKPSRGLVTLEADTVLLFGGDLRCIAEGKRRRRTAFPRHYLFRVSLGGTVAGLALQAGKGGSGVVLSRVPGVEDGDDRVRVVLVVALQASVGAALGIAFRGLWG